MLASAAVGGTASVIGGRRFTNGAGSEAFGTLVREATTRPTFGGVAVTVDVNQIDSPEYAKEIRAYLSTLKEYMHTGAWAMADLSVINRQHQLNKRRFARWEVEVASMRRMPNDVANAAAITVGVVGAAPFIVEALGPIAVRATQAAIRNPRCIEAVASGILNAASLSNMQAGIALNTLSPADLGRSQAGALQQSLPPDRFKPSVCSLF